MNLNLITLYLQCPQVGFRMIPLEAWELPSGSCTLGHLKARRRRRVQAKEEPKTTGEENTYEHTIYPTGKAL